MFQIILFITSVLAVNLRYKTIDTRFKVKWMYQQPNQITCYGIMFDAGSSGTRVYVYNWDCRQIQTLNYIKVTENAPQKKVKPGISTFSSHVEDLPKYMEQFISFVDQHVPEEMKKYTPIMLAATAGMRILPKEDQDNIIKKIRELFRKSGYLFLYDEWARVITGQEEGAFLWLSINYLLEQLGRDSEETALTIDLGGASTQLVQKVTETLPSNEMDLVIPNFNEYQIYSISHLYYGSDQAQLKIDSQFPQENPCYFKGYEQENIIGTGNINQCREAIRKYLNNDPENCKFSNCGINGQFQPQFPEELMKQIYGVSGIQTGAELFHLEEFTLQQFFDLTVEFCSKTYQEIMEIQEYRENPYITTDFFYTLYVYELLSYGYKIPQNAIIKAPASLNGVTPTWTLAAMFYQVGQVDCRHDSPVCSSVQILI